VTMPRFKTKNELPITMPRHQSSEQLDEQVMTAEVVVEVVEDTFDAQWGI